MIKLLKMEKNFAIVDFRGNQLTFDPENPKDSQEYLLDGIHCKYFFSDLKYQNPRIDRQLDDYIRKYNDECSCYLCFMFDLDDDDNIEKINKIFNLSLKYELDFNFHGEFISLNVIPYDQNKNSQEFKDKFKFFENNLKIRDDLIKKGIKTYNIVLNDYGVLYILYSLTLYNCPKVAVDQTGNVEIKYSAISKNEALKLTEEQYSETKIILDHFKLKLFISSSNQKEQLSVRKTPSNNSVEFGSLDYKDYIEAISKL